MSIRFAVKEVFTVNHRGLMAIAVGRLLAGRINPPVTLHDERTKAPIKIRGTDPLISKTDPPLIPLQVDETSTTRPSAGMILVSHNPD